MNKELLRQLILGLRNKYEVDPKVCEVFDYMIEEKDAQIKSEKLISLLQSKQR